MDHLLDELDVLRDLLIAKINDDGTVTYLDPDTTVVPVNMSYGDVKIIGKDGVGIIVDGGQHPVVYTMVAPGELSAFLVGREWAITAQDVIDAFNERVTDQPIGIRIG